MLAQMWTTIQTHKVLSMWVGGASIVVFIAGLAMMPPLLALIPEDYFVKPPQPPPTRGWRILLIAWHVLRNLAGGLLLLTGLAMIVLPGPGLVTILLGVMFMHIPGKRRLEIWLIQKKSVNNSVTWLRSRWGKPPLLLPPVKQGVKG